MEVIGMSQGGQQPLEFNTSSLSAESYENTILKDTEEMYFPTVSEYDKSKANNVIGKKDIKDVADKINELMDKTSTHLKFEVYGKFKDIVFKIVDDSTNKVIKEVPPTKIIDMIDKFCEMSGIFMDEKAWEQW